MKLTKIFNLLNIVISLFSLATLQYDFFVSDEFRIETIFWVGLSILLLLNVFRHLIKSVYSVIWFSFLTNGLITGIGCFVFYILGLTLFGYGFSGRQIPLIWFVVTFLNTALFTTTITEILKKINGIKRNTL